MNKPITDILEVKKNKPTPSKGKELLPSHWQTLSATELANLITKLEKEMLKLAEKLEFEKATKIRESIKDVKEFLLLNS